MLGHLTIDYQANFYLMNILIKDWANPSKNETKAIDQNLDKLIPSKTMFLISKPGTIRITTQSTNIFSSQENKPKVMIFIGKKRILRIGLTTF